MSFGWVEKEKQVKSLKVLFWVHYLFETVRIHIRQSDPDPYQKGMDPQHWLHEAVLQTVANISNVISGFRKVFRGNREYGKKRLIRNREEHKMFSGA
jgi:hypothetical protein